MNRCFSLLTGTVLAGVLFLLSPARAEPPSEEWREMQQAFSAVKTIRTDFTQKKTMKILQKPLVSEGTFCYRTPSDIRWEYTAPLRTVLLMDGGDVARYTWRGTSWEKDSGAGLEAMHFVLQDISGWVSGDFDSSRHFRAELQKGPPLKVILSPRDPSIGSFIQRVLLTLSSTPGVLQSVEIVEGPGNTTLIDFRNTEINVSFPEGLFRDAP